MSKVYERYVCNCNHTTTIEVSQQQHINIITQMMFPICVKCGEVIKEALSYHKNDKNDLLSDPKTLSWVSYMGEDNES